MIVTSATHNKHLVLLLATMLSVASVQAQSYCSPTFAYGCSLWSNQSIHLDSITWQVDPYYCDLSDYTWLSTTLIAGTTYNMQVSNGNWCGCGVWIDLNQDMVFDTSENVFHLYLANETNNYNVPITIPANINSGSYRMRVIAGWGSDCFNPGANGYGPCGIYQYGNFDDFTINVEGYPSEVISISDDQSSFIEVNPNPVASTLTVSIKNAASTNAILQLTDVSGKIIQSRTVINEKELIDMSDLAEGIYYLSYRNGSNRQTIKLVK